MPREAARIRELGPKDWSTLRELRLAALADAPDAFGSTSERERAFTEETWRSRLAPSAVKCSWLAERGGEALGLVHAQLDAEHAGRAWLMAMWVRPAARRQGVARQLVDVVTEWARSKRAHELRLQVTEGNREAESLYRASGYRATDEREPLRPGSPHSALTLVMPL